MAWDIVRHAFVIVFGNFGNALRASLVPTLLLVGAFFGLGTMMNFPVANGMIDVENIAQPGTTALAGLALGVFAMFVFAWVAVTWHRFILLEEYPSFIPAVSGRPIWAYVGRTLMIVLQMMVVMIPLMFLIMPLLMNLPAVGGVFAIGLSILLTFLWLRVCVSLPSVAVGSHMGSVEAWGETAEIWQTILGVCFIMGILNFVAGLLPAVLASNLPFVAGVMSIAIQWVSMMIGVSVLTTIYGHVVEGRPLSGA